MSKFISLIKAYSSDIIKSVMAAIDIYIVLFVLVIWPVVVAFVI